jgi:multiple sugar transport system substrate-binding protein
VSIYIEGDILMHRAMPSWLRRSLAASAIAAFAVLPPAHVSHAASTITLTLETPNGTFWPTISNSLIKAYTKVHPNVKFQIQTVDGATYPTKMEIQAAAGTLADVIVTADAFNLPFAVHGVALNMQPYVDKDPGYNIGDIYPNFLNLGRVKGNSGLYMIPFSADAIVTFYNKDMFTAAGVPFPQANWTYAQFLDAAQKLTKTAGGKTTQWGLDLGSTFSWPVDIPWMMGFGGGLLNSAGTQTTFSSPGSIAGWQALQDLLFKTKVAVPVTSETQTNFLTGKAAMAFGVHANVSGYQAAIGKKFAWDVQEMPSFPNGKHVDGMGTAGYAISANSKQRAAAWDFVSFVGSVAGQTALSKTGANMPVRKSMLNNPVWRQPNLNNGAFLKAIQYGITPPQLSTNDAALNCGTVYTGLMATTLGNVADKIFRGGSVAAALKSADSTVNGCIASLGD